MVVEVRLYATLRRQAPAGSAAGVFRVTLPEGSTVNELLRTIGIAPGEVHLLMVNGVSATVKQRLNEGDRVGMFPPVGGG